MNKARRKLIDEVISKIDDLMADIDAIRSEEDEAYENLPIAFQEGDRGDAMSEAISNLEDAMSSLEEAEDYLNEAKGE